MKPEIKKLLILNLPYLLFVYLFDKVGAAVRLSPGIDRDAPERPDRSTRANAAPKPESQRPCAPDVLQL